MANLFATFSLGSIWTYRPEGVVQILREMNALDLDYAHFSFNNESQTFKVEAHNDHVGTIQGAFSAIMKRMEDGVNIYDVVHPSGYLEGDIEGHAWLKGVRDNLVEPLAGHDAVNAKSFECPAYFDTWQSKRAWRKLDERHPIQHKYYPSASRLLSTQDLADIKEATGAIVSWDLRGRTIYIGADTEDAIDVTIRKIETLLKWFDEKDNLPAWHVVFAEHHLPKNFMIDARIMRLMNRTLVLSTLFHPSMKEAVSPQESLTPEEFYNKLSQHAVTLRIALKSDQPGRWQSLIGPESSPVFPFEERRRWCAWVHNFTYPSKSRGLPAIESQDAETGEAKIKDWMTPVTTAAPVALPTHTGATASEHKPAPVTAAALSNGSSNDNGNYNGNDNGNGTGDGNGNGTGDGNGNGTGDGNGNVTGTNTGNGGKKKKKRARKNKKGKNATQTQAQAPVEAHTQAQSEIAQIGSSIFGRHTKTLQRPAEFEFASHVDAALRKQLEFARTKIGTFNIRVDFGRVALMGFTAQAISFNKADQHANPWEPEELLKKMNRPRVHDTSTQFTPILSIFGQDAEHMAYLQQDGRPMWAIDRSDLVYEFACKRTFVDGKPQSSTRLTATFHVDVDGSAKSGFTYHLRGVKDDMPGVWVNCLKRNWDLKIIPTCTRTKSLEANYGAFAKKLVESIEIPPNTTGVPLIQFDYDTTILRNRDSLYYDIVEGVQVRHSVRFLSQDKKSILEIKSMRSMELEKFASKSATYPTGNMEVKKVASNSATHPTGTIKATMVKEDLNAGIAAGWYEASIYAVAAPTFFAGHEKMTIGDEASWTPECLRKSGILDPLMRPATAMVQQMDGVGAHVNNGTLPLMQKHGFNTTAREYREFLTARTEEFW